MEKKKVIVICGPTASGKTALSIELAKKIDGEIVSCDSMQIYKEMNIGTAKPTLEEMQGIKHYMIDTISPEQRYSVADYKTDAEKAIENIEKQRIYKQFERISETNGTIQKQSKQGIQLRKRLYIKIGIMRYKMTDRAG